MAIWDVILKLKKLKSLNRVTKIMANPIKTINMKEFLYISFSYFIKYKKENNC